MTHCDLANGGPGCERPIWGNILALKVQFDYDCNRLTGLQRQRLHLVRAIFEQIDLIRTLLVNTVRLLAVLRQAICRVTSILPRM